MKPLMILLFFVVCGITGKAQNENNYNEIDKIVLDIPASQTNTTAGIAAYVQKHFDTDGKKVRAAYTWVITNIKYDTDSIHRVILDEDREVKVTYALRRRKGVCENFAAIFNGICIKSGIRSFVIEGYTKQNGSINKSPHAWCAALVDNNWFLFDPTWDAGFIRSGRFISQIKTNYFQVSPINFIDTHMPIDPLFQFLNYPFTYKEFSEGNAKINNSNSFFNYADSINVYEKLDPLSRYLATIYRIEKYGWQASINDTKLKQIKLEIEIIYQDKDMALYNSAVADYNDAIAIFNIFLNYRNNQFQPAKSNDEVESMFNRIGKLVPAANLKLNEVNRSKARLILDTGDIQKKLNGLTSNVKEQEIFLKNYLSALKEK